MQYSVVLQTTLLALQTTLLAPWRIMALFFVGTLLARFLRKMLLWPRVGIPYSSRLFVASNLGNNAVHTSSESNVEYFCETYGVSS